MAAMYLSPLALIGDTAATDEEIDLEVRSTGYLPSDPFSGIIIPAIPPPPGTHHSPYGGILFECLAKPIIEGYIFRKLLFDAFLVTTSPLHSHALVMIATSAVTVALHSQREHYYKLKNSHDNDDPYDFINPPDANVHTLSLPYQPFLLQLVYLCTGRLYWSIGMDCVMRLVREVSLGTMRDDLVVSPDTFRPYYNLAVEITAAVDAITSYFVSVPLKFTNRDTTPTTAMVDKILEKQQKLSQCASVSTLPGADHEFLVGAVTFHVNKLPHYSMEELLPPSCEHANDTLITGMARSNSSAEAIIRDTLPISTVPSTPRTPNWVGLFRSEDDYAAVRLFASQTDKVLSERYYNGSGSVEILRAVLSSIINLQEPGYNFAISSDELIRRVFYWDESASGEDILDLIQVKHEHMRKRLCRCAEEFPYTVGGLELVLLQGKVEVNESDLMEYYAKLDSYLNVIQQREEVFFCELFGLTKWKYDTIVDQWKAKSQEVIELDQAWVKYFESNEFKQELVAIANPHAVLKRECVRDDSDGEGNDV